MPNVEGANQDTYFQKSGTATPGHEIPEMNNKGKEVNTNINIQVSRWYTRMEHVMAKNIHANK